MSSSNASSDLYSRLIAVIKAWRRLRPGKTFANLSLEGFEKEVAPSFETRKDVDAKSAALSESIEHRDDADKHSRKVLQRVVSGVKADEEEGEDGELYSAMGYVPRSVRNRLRGVRSQQIAAAEAAAEEEEKTEA